MSLMGPMGHMGKDCFPRTRDIAAPSVPDGWLRKLSRSAAPESYLKTIYKTRCAGVESFAPLAGPANAG